jgi:hypothetical protein
LGAREIKELWFCPYMDEKKTLLDGILLTWFSGKDTCVS